MKTKLPCGCPKPDEYAMCINQEHVPCVDFHRQGVYHEPCWMMLSKRELPKYKRYQKTTDPKYIDGWNACLDEITKGK